MTDRLAVDVSNYTRPVPLRTTEVHCWMANGVDRVIVQAVQGGGNYPVGQTPQQMQVCTEAGVRTDSYILPFNGDNYSNLRAKRSLVGRYPVGRWWGDFEESMSLAYIRFVLTEMDTWPATYKQVGFYSAEWYYNGNFTPAERREITSDPFFYTRPLWIMDNQRAAGSPRLFGGWSDYAMHQYRLDATLCGVSGIDISFVNPLFEQGGAPVAIHVGQGMADRMQAAGDRPLFGHVWEDMTDDDGQAYRVEKCYGTQGLYVSSNIDGPDNWLNAGPF